MRSSFTVRPSPAPRSSSPSWRRPPRAATSQRRRPRAAAAKPPIGVDYPRADSDFWNSYIKYVPQYAQASSAST